MQYRKGAGDDCLSMLAYGCMRFTKKNGKIDLEKAEQEIMEAVALGVNYFDTAYIYNGSEVALGEIISRNHCREKIYIADKLPHYLIRSKEGLEKTFQEQLNRLGTDYIDYYLMHMLTDVGTWEKLKKIGIEEWIRQKKESGQIRHIGFSYHGNTETFRGLIDAYAWEFCMIQYNYLDEFSQAGKAGLHYAHEKGLPVMIMEPLRGGRLVNQLPRKAKALIENHPQGYSPAEWAFRWLWNQKEVTAVLSGMNSLEMLRENARIASEMTADSFAEDDFALIEQVKEEIHHSMKVGCTGCGYCMPCPKGVDIPGAFHAWNIYHSQDKKAARWSYIQCTACRRETSSASQCIGCGKCEAHCPQGIAIREALKGAVADLENLTYKGAKLGVKLLKLW